MDENIKRKQALLGVRPETKELIDKNFKIKGFGTRAKYLKHLLEQDNKPNLYIEPVIETPSE